MRLSTGRLLEIGGGGNEVIGISSDLKVTEGYDTSLNWWPHHDGLDWLADDDKLEAKRVMT
jgi:hypothetical protein